MTTRADLARRAVAIAARTRLCAGLDSYRAICVYDLVQSTGIDLWFHAVPTLEGMYSPGEPPIIVISSLRPSGRQRMTCAHELGHHVFGHGTRLDELQENRAYTSDFNADEFLVNCFAEYLLMPKLAVLAALNKRGLNLADLEPTDVFGIASYFGVGYLAMIHHLQRNLGEISDTLASILRRLSPKEIRERIAGPDVKGELILADEEWSGRPIDLHVGDALVVPRGASIEGDRLVKHDEGPLGSVYSASRPGLGRVSTSSWASFLRVARRVSGGGFVGRSIFRYEEEVVEE